MALVRVAERSSLPPLPYQRKCTCARNHAGAVSPCTRWVKTKPPLARPGADFCHTPSFGALTGAKSVAGATRTKRSKRIHMRFVPATAGIDPTNVAIRAVAAGPLWHAASLARSGGAWACAAAGSARARRAMRAARRMAHKEQRRPRNVAGPTRSDERRIVVPGKAAGCGTVRQHGPNPWLPPGAARRCSGDLVQRAVAALGRGQPPALGRDRSALHAVRVVDDHVDVAEFVPPTRVLGDLVDPGGAHPRPRLGHLARHVLAHADVVGGVVAGRVARDVHARELVEGVLAVGLGIAVLLVAEVHRRLGVAVVGPAPAGEAALGG